MDGILDVLEFWLMVLLGGAILAGLVVFGTMALMFSLRVIEGAVTGSRHALQARLSRLLTRAATRSRTGRASRTQRGHSSI